MRQADLVLPGDRSLVLTCGVLRRAAGRPVPDPGRPRELDGFASRVLDVVDAIPPGRVMSYGDIAEYLGDGGPRQVGRVMALWGGGVAWWRVIHADGTPAPGHERAALARYRQEGTPLCTVGSPVRVDMRRARWPDPPRLSPVLSAASAGISY